MAGPPPANLQASYAGEFIGRAMADGRISEEVCHGVLWAGLGMYATDTLRGSFTRGFYRGIATGKRESLHSAVTLIHDASIKGKV